MLTITLNDTLQERLILLTQRTHNSIEQVISDSLALYAEHQEDNECLAIIAERENEPSVSYADVLTRLKADGIL